MISQEEKDKIVNELKETYPIEQQVSFNEFNLNDKLEENTKLKVKYQELLDNEQYILDKIKEKSEDIKGQVYDYYRFEYDRNLQKTEIENYYLNRHPKVKKINDLIDKQEIRVKFFKICVNAIDRLYWAMKNYVDHNR